MFKCPEGEVMGKPLRLRVARRVLHTQVGAAHVREKGKDPAGRIVGVSSVTGVFGP